MTFLKNFKMGSKLGLGFGFVLLLTVILGFVCIVQIAKVKANTLDLATNWLPSVETIGRLEVDASAMRRYELNYLITEDEKVKQSNL